MNSDQAMPGGFERIAREVSVERTRQDLKFGTNRHLPVVSVHSLDPGWFETPADFYGLPSSKKARRLCDQETETGDLSWGHVLVEELAEVLDAKTDEERREELVQLAAVCFAAIENLDRKKAGLPLVCQHASKTLRPHKFVCEECDR